MKGIIQKEPADLFYKKTVAKTFGIFTEKHPFWSLFLKPRTKSSIYDGAFFTSVKSYFKNVLNSIELPLGYISYTNHSFVKKLTTAKTSGEKVFC